MTAAQLFAIVLATSFGAYILGRIDRRRDHHVPDPGERQREPFRVVRVPFDWAEHERDEEVAA